MFPSAPCRSCCCDLEHEEKEARAKGALDGGRPPFFLILNSTAGETPAGTCKGKI